MAGIDRDYSSWSFTDRWFWYAMGVSVLWHAFWFFSVTIVVTSPVKRSLTQPIFVALGPVIDDAIFRTIVETRPEASKAFYRQPADFSTATDLPVETMPRYAPGDVVSLPEGKRFTSRLRDSVGGEKGAIELPSYPGNEESLS